MSTKGNYLKFFSCFACHVPIKDSVSSKAYPPNQKYDETFTFLKENSFTNSVQIVINDEVIIA